MGDHSKYTIFILTLFFVSISLGREIFVDNQLTDDCIGTYSIANRDCSGSDGNAYNSPQEAASASAAGDTVYIRAGTYTQAARIIIAGKTGTGPTAKITLTNYNSEEVIIDGNGVASVAYTGLITISNSNYIVVSGLRLTNYARKGVSYDHSDYGEVSDLVLDNLGEDGIWVYYSDHVDIENVVAHDNGAGGIFSQLSDYTNVTYCLTYDNVGRGIFFMAVSHGTIDRNETSGNFIGIYTNWHDTSQTQSTYNVITNNLCYSNTVDTEDSDGLEVSSGSWYTTVYNNVVYGNADDGIDTSSGSGGGGVSSPCYNTITNNIVFNSGVGSGDGNGIKVSTNSGGGHIIGNNVCFNNKRSGFDQDKASGYPQNVFYNNTVYNNGINPASGGHSGFVMDAPSLPQDEDAVLYNNISTNSAYKDLYRSNELAVNDSDYNLWGDVDFVSGMDIHSLSGDPGFSDPCAVIDTNFVSSWSIDEKLEYIRSQVREKFSLQAGSQAIDAGTIITGYHNATAGDEAGELRVWYGTAPDIGAYEYTSSSSDNNAPVLSSIGAKSVDENALLSFSVSATDADSDTITYSATNLPTGATFSSQAFSWTPGYAQAGSCSVTFTASDGTDSDSEVVTITVDNTNRAPVLAAIGSKSANENASLSFSISATDADSDTITYSATNLPTGATFSSGSFSWTPGYGEAGSYNVTFTASDGTDTDSEVVTITVTVSNVNRTPVLAAIGSKSANEGSVLSFSVSATDPDIDDSITYSAATLPTGSAFASQTFTWTPGYAQAGTHEVTFTASDGTAEDSETVTITVNNTNRAPVLDAIADKSANENTLLTFGISATDPDGDPVSYSATGLPSGATFASQTFSWTPSSSQAGSSHEVTFIADDGQLNDSQIVTITVTDTLAPSVTNLSPAAGSIQAPLNSLIILHVTDAGKGVNAGTVTITLDGSTIYSGNTSNYVSATGNCRRIGTTADYTYAYQSSQTFDFDQAITVAVNATDLAGNVMIQQSYSFRTEMRSFGQNKSVDSTVKGLDKAAPATAADSSGNIWAVWHAGAAGRAGSRDIYIARLAAGSTSFGVAKQITTDSADQHNPALALGTDDKLYVVWQDNRNGDWDIYGSTSIGGTTWSAQRRITDSNDNQINPAIAIDSQSPNRAYIVWQDDRSGNEDIYVAVSANAFLTNLVTRITSNTSDQTTPAIAIDSSNTAYVVWTDARNATTDIYGASAGAWTNVPIVNNSANQSNPAIAVESTGSILHFAWVDQAAGNSDIYYASSNGLPSSPLTGTNLIDDDTPGAEQLSPAIAVTGSAGSNLKVFACWLDERNVSGSTGDTDIYLVQTNAGSGANVFISDGTANSNQTEPAMGTDQYGYPYIVWTDDRGANTEIYFAASTFMQSSALASQLITAASGGTVGTDPNAITGVDDVSIVLPAGACPYDVTIAITKIENPHDHALPGLKGYDFGPSGIVFNTPVTITIPLRCGYDVGAYLSYWYDSRTGALSRQGITDVEVIVITPTLHAMRFKTTHFTPFYVAAAAAAAGGGGGGGGGGGCSVSPAGQSSILEMLVPCLGLAVVMAILKLRDARSRNTRNISGGKS